MKKIFFASLIAGTFLIGVPAGSDATEYQFSGPCKSFAFTLLYVDNLGSMTKYNFRDISYSSNNAYIAFDDANGTFWGEIDMPNSTIFFSPHETGSGNLVMNYARSRMAVNCDVWIEEYSSKYTYGYAGSAKVEASLSAVKAVFRFQITCSNAYYTDDYWNLNIWQDPEAVQKVTLPSITGYLY